MSDPVSLHDRCAGPVRSGSTSKDPHHHAAPPTERVFLDSLALLATLELIEGLAGPGGPQL